LFYKFYYYFIRVILLWVIDRYTR